jgi:hypothetical protein
MACSARRWRHERAERHPRSGHHPIEVQAVAHANRSRRSAPNSKLLQLFVPPSEVKGGTKKLPSDSAEQAAETSDLLEVVN